MEQGNSLKVAELAPKTIPQAIEQGWPMSVLAKVVGNDKIIFQIKWELANVVSLINSNLNLNDYQLKLTAELLYDAFPNESLQDFQLCFRKGLTGQYGTLYSMDVTVLSGWMGKYLDEKYNYVENFNPHKAEDVPDVDYKKFKERLDEERKKSVKHKSFKEERKRQLDELNYISPNPEYVVMKELKKEWGLLFHDIQTGKPTDDYIAFEEWIKLTG